MDDETLREKVQERQGAKEIIDQLTVQIEACNVDIKAALAERQVERLVVDQWEPKIIRQERSSIDAKALLSAGVTIDQITAATTVTQVVSLRVDKAPRPK